MTHQPVVTSLALVLEACERLTERIKPYLKILKIFCKGKKNDCNLGKTWNSTGYGTRSICDDGTNIIDDDDVLGELEIFL